MRVLHGPPLTIRTTGIFYVANASVGVTLGWNGLKTVSAAQNSSGKADYPAAGEENNYSPNVPLKQNEVSGPRAESTHKAVN